MTIISSDLLQSTNLVTSGISTRLGGVSPEPLCMNLSFNVGDDKNNVRKNRELFFHELGIREEQIAFPLQVHSSVVKSVDSTGSYPACDGLITSSPGIYLCISIADCVPILMVETRQHVVAAIHAGWRGTSAMILQKSVNFMIDEWDCKPEHLITFIGPSASACCYSVGEEVAGKFAGEFIINHEGKMLVDLKAANVAQLVEAGVSRNAIEVSPHCTIGDSLFHSYRRDKERSGRMMAVIGLKPDSVR